jgi:hypothetical protein
MVFSGLIDDFLLHDRAVVQHLFPRISHRLEAMGLFDRDTLLFLLPLFVALHDTLGHRLPYPLHHWVKQNVGEFLMSSFEDMGADSQFYWMATAPEMRALMLELVSPEILEVWPYIWLLKRFCHYAFRGTATDPYHGALMHDNDARVGSLEWSFFLKHGAVVQLSDGTYDFDSQAFSAAADRLLEAWLDVEKQVPQGLEAYARGICDFHRSHIQFDPTDGRWMVPCELRDAFDAVRRGARLRRRG